MASQDAAGDAVPTMLDGDSPALLKYSGAAWAMLFRALLETRPDGP